jgi:hypothetical protein
MLWIVIFGPIAPNAPAAGNFTFFVIIQKCTCFFFKDFFHNVFGTTIQMFLELKWDVKGNGGYRVS